MYHFLRLAAALGLLSAASSLYALESARPAPIPPSSIIDSGSIFQALFSLLLVLIVIVSVVWLLKRMNIAQNGAGDLVKVIGSVAIGQRERAVLIEVKNTWLLVGVGPGQIRTLHSQDKPEGLPTENLQGNLTNNKFANMLSAIVSRKTSERDKNAS